MVLVYLILGTLIFSSGLVKLLLKLMKATVLVLSNFSYYSSMLFTNTFMPFSTLLGEVSIFLHPTAMIASSSFIKFLLNDKQLIPSSLTWRLKCDPHYFGFFGSSADMTFRKPSDSAIARQRPYTLLGMNLMSSIALFYCILWMDVHWLF